ncbi:unnamed protein product [Rotaria socialis]|uniref:Uncharacterized protein n=2 Tax=Rotaria socialis TaxID=392032 RepID=A0A819W1K1_9BILA|nr:unnamed protein product [Rotaria socialis]CAF4117547.1 unnamed protein product [Rotaria socialis]CAF4128964.1 unnamed protein product [Rotaria socialis]
MKGNCSTMTPTNSTSDLTFSRAQQTSQPALKLLRRSSVSSTTQRQNFCNNNKRCRPNPSASTYDFLSQGSSSSLSIPILSDTMNNFFQATKTMEEEILLPSRLKDIPVEELVFDNAVQPDNWHDIYTFVRGMRNQLQRSYPFATDDDDDNNNNSKEQHRKQSNDDEGIIIPYHDNNQFSSASSTTSSDEFDRSSTSSASTPYETIKGELKCHYYGLFRTLDTLMSMANRVTEKYREESTF